MRRTLRQKDRIPDETLESDAAPTKPNLSGTKTERMNKFFVCAFFWSCFEARKEKEENDYGCNSDRASAEDTAL